ncbi:MAG TPA: hypothetical protein VK061_10260 [Bacillota bacterium]|nr:hypothetical protein [Bacillota bacterium]
MTNVLLVTYYDNEKAIFHIAPGNRIADVIEELEEETGKKIIKYEWKHKLQGKSDQNYSVPDPYDEE